jgi:ABC-type dipeptide/oligopeptide/nickel transport system permease component
MRVVTARMASSVGAIFGASLLAFVFLRLAPGDPVGLILGQYATPAARAHLSHQMGLDQSIPAQYFHYVTGFLQGDWGYSYSNGASVRHIIGSRLPASLELSLYAFAFVVCGAFALALLTTYKRRRGITRATQAINVLALGLPQFWLGLVLLVMLSQQIQLFPGPEGRLSADMVPPPSVSGLYTVDAVLSGQPSVFFDAMWHLALPAFALGFASMAFLCRVLQANLLEVSREPYVLVAESKGLSRWSAFVRHALPNALVPTLTASGILLGILLGGGVLVETTFAWPGIGALITDGVQKQDFSVVQTFVLLAAAVFVLVNLVVDLLAARIDPRIREGATR